jgi:hypothetical protein
LNCTATESPREVRKENLAIFITNEKVASCDEFEILSLKKKIVSKIQKKN